MVKWVAAVACRRLVKNTAKYNSYKYAWGRIKGAQQAGFHLEAVTIAESIIADRLLSYVHEVDPHSKFTIHNPLSKLIEQWRHVAGPRLKGSDGIDLGEAVNAWRKKRNDVLHGLVKSTPATATMQVEEFISLACDTANEGKKLARKVDDWVRTAKKADRN